MDIRKLQRAIVDGLEDVKGQNIVVFNTEHLSPLFERVVIASGTSNRQTKALAASVRDAVKASGFPILRTEGEGNGEWIIVDCGAAVVHLMQPSIREYYHLEEIWGDKPVKLKLDSGPVRLVKAAEPDAVDGAGGKGVPKKMAASKTAAKKVAAKRAAPRKAAEDETPAKAAARKVVAGKAPAKTAARKAAPVKRSTAATGGVTRTVGVKSAASKAAPAKAPRVKTLVVNAPVPKKTAAGKAPARKAAPRKTAARKTAGA